MADIKNRISMAAAPLRRTIGRWWGGIGCRISLLMSAALILVAVLVGAFFFWQGKNALNAEIRSRALYVAKVLSTLTVNDIITGNRIEIHKKIAAAFTSNDEAQSGSDLLYLMIYDHKCDLLIGSTASEVFFDRSSYFNALPSAKRNEIEEVSISCKAEEMNAPVFILKKTGVYDLTHPVMAGNELVGFIRVGISGQRYLERFSEIVKKAAIAMLGILLIGIAVSQIIAVGITGPILRLSEAADKLSRQNWESPISIKGSDEISKLGHAFNQMALTLKQREVSLSRGNKDLFILHAAGLDLMESLDLETLLAKIAARAEDIVKADTISIGVLDCTQKMIRYLGMFGSSVNMLKDMDMPLESGGIYNWIASYGTPLLIQDAQSDFRLDSALMKSLGIKCIMTVPLWSSNTMTGFLTAVNKKNGTSFDKHDLRLFTVFSNLAGAALQNASLYADLTGKMKELRTAQEQLVHSTKMAAIGELAANIAHEVNNPLTSVLGYTTHLMKTLGLPESAKKILGMMEQETLRVRKIIRNLLDFSRQKNSWMRPTDILLPLRETVAFVQGAAQSSLVKIHEEYGGSPVIINMDPNEMKQVFINMINNALQSMPQGGDLRIRLRPVGEHEAVIEFADTGAGISPENLQKIFEPFFSTKEDQDGTGLGLSISYRIVQHHGGRIDVESEPGKGTIFRIILPLNQKAVPIERP
jgi:signal transduction histidine kinase